jgi:hypothetical protein
MPPLLRYSRRFARVLSQWTGISTSRDVVVDEMEGRGHWFDNITDDKYMQRFFNEHMYEANSTESGEGAIAKKSKPSLPQSFVVYTLSTWSEGRGGVRILQPNLPRTAATIHVDLPPAEATSAEREGEWRLRTNNVRRSVVRGERCAVE